MGLFGAFLGVVSSAVSVVSNALSSVAGSLGSFVSNALKIAGPWIGTISNIVSAVAKALGALNQEDNLDELGAKAMQADKKPEDFDSYQEYIEYLRNEIKLDKEKFEKAGEVEKLARKAVGTGIAMKSINEKKDVDIPIETWVAFGKLGFDETKAKEIDTFIDVLKNGKLEDFAKYVDGKLEGIDKNIEMGDTLVSVYKELEPNSSIEEIEKKVMAMQVGDKEPPKGV